MGDISELYDHLYPEIDEDDTDVVCKHCEASCLSWEITPAGWRLFNEDGSLHECNDPFAILKELECQNQTHRIVSGPKSKKVTKTSVGIGKVR